MSIREITNGRFNGLRVQRTVGGAPIIHTWSYRIPVRRKGVTAWRDATEAEKRSMAQKASVKDKELQTLQKAAVVKKVFDPFDVTSRNNTGIRGVNYRIHKERGYYVEAFFITVTDSDGHACNRYFRISTNGWKGAWKLAIQTLHTAVKLTPAQYKRCLSNVPNENIREVE